MPLELRRDYLNTRLAEEALGRQPNERASQMRPLIAKHVSHAEGHPLPATLQIRF